MDINEYLDIFIEESKEHIQSLNEHLLALENDPSNKTIVNEIFRSAHTLKGMSATMGYQDLADLTHNMENVLDAVRNDQLILNDDMIDVVFHAVDALDSMIQDIIAGGEGHKDVTSLVKKLSAIENGETLSSNYPNQSNIAENRLSEIDNMQDRLDQFELAVLQQSSDSGFKNYQVTVKLEESCLLKAARVYMIFEIFEQIGEVIKSIPAVSELEEENFDYEFTAFIVTKEASETIEQKVKKVSEVEKVIAIELDVSQIDRNEKTTSDAQLNKKTDAKSSPKNADEKGKTTQKLTRKTIRVNIDRLDTLMNLFEELVIDRGRLEQIATTLADSDLKETVERITRVTGELQNNILNMRMVTIDHVFNRFPRMVRQLARDLNKEVDLQVKGEQTELDRTVIDEIGDPLVHLIRNALDHGIETPDTRLTNGKSTQGVLKLEAYHSGNHVFIEIADDGAGIDPEKIKSKAIANDLISEEQADSLSEEQIFNLMMESGFSTADKISDISGRGVGLDVVRNTIESLGGSISIESTLNEGTTFIVKLPLTLSIISVLLIEVEKETYAIPLSSILETAIIHKDDIKTVNNKEVIDFRGKVVPLVSLKQVFNVPGEGAKSDYHSIVIIRQGEKMTALIVESFIGQQEVVLKPLGNYLTDVYAISGATILGDGQVALIVDTNALIK